jgi:hypothetical protein
VSNPQCPVPHGKAIMRAKSMRIKELRAELKKRKLIWRGSDRAELERVLTEDETKNVKRKCECNCTVETFRELCKTYNATFRGIGKNIAKLSNYN